MLGASTGKACFPRLSSVLRTENCCDVDDLKKVPISSTEESTLKSTGESTGKSTGENTGESIVESARESIGESMGESTENVLGKVLEKVPISSTGESTSFDDSSRSSRMLKWNGVSASRSWFSALLRTMQLMA